MMNKDFSKGIPASEIKTTQEMMDELIETISKREVWCCDNCKQYTSIGYDTCWLCGDKMTLEEKIKNDKKLTDLNAALECLENVSVKLSSLNMNTGNFRTALIDIRNYRNRYLANIVDSFVDD